ncbi:RNA 2',3'-cyclic phosphodiesterase [Thermoflavimicrobium dichotomicum]|uniref:RNA 2',3'-cyclic phosphodiesterase n=1 Tax=Thermoflavimicrobium dichotomicum TaxID=46223 RepID=A0A1I3TMU7_9BACL|nr:RNA 2',3'-cyclic phosphodiesterase [Thermoflavimicrobium dichotomicum]SFJ70867.1 2'-5' RNA ligase [Thermoflavimicrobium dichotomicum]
MKDIVTKRIFVAVPLPSGSKEQLAGQVEQWKQAFPFQKWVDPEDYHITLFFLGNCTEGKIDQVVSALEKVVSTIRPFSLSFSHLGTFGNKNQPRIFWMGMEGDLSQLQMLQQRVVQTLEPIGFRAEDRPYRPHITLARKCKDSAFSLPAFPANLKQTWIVDRIVLYETKLGMTPMYHVLKTYPLG